LPSSAKHSILQAMNENEGGLREGIEALVGSECWGPSPALVPVPDLRWTWLEIS
jgi:hypothetical protein